MLKKIAKSVFEKVDWTEELAGLHQHTSLLRLAVNRYLTLEKVELCIFSSSTPSWERLVCESGEKLCFEGKSLALAAFCDSCFKAEKSDLRPHILISSITLWNNTSNSKWAQNECVSIEQVKVHKSWCWSSCANPKFNQLVSGSYIEAD